MPLMSTTWLGLARRSFMRGMRLWPPERILASEPSLTRRPVASSIVRGAWYSKAPGIMSAPFRLAGDVLWFDKTEDRAETYWGGMRGQTGPGRKKTRRRLGGAGGITRGGESTRRSP